MHTIKSFKYIIWNGFYETLISSASEMLIILEGLLATSWPRTFHLTLISLKDTVLWWRRHLINLKFKLTTRYSDQITVPQVHIWPNGMRNILTVRLTNIRTFFQSVDLEADLSIDFLVLSTTFEYRVLSKTEYFEVF